MPVSWSIAYEATVPVALASGLACSLTANRKRLLGSKARNDGSQSATTWSWLELPGRGIVPEDVDALGLPGAGVRPDVDEIRLHR